MKPKQKPRPAPTRDQAQTAADVATDEVRELFERWSQGVRSTPAPVALAQIAARLAPLLAEHGIPDSDPARWLRLALVLAEKHEPGFRPPPPPRDPTVWTLDNRYNLTRAVMALSKSGLSVSKACARLAGEEPWQSLVTARDDVRRAELLRERYVREMSRPIQVWVDAATDEVVRIDRAPSKRPKRGRS